MYVKDFDIEETKQKNRKDWIGHVSRAHPLIKHQTRVILKQDAHQISLAHELVEAVPAWGDLPCPRVLHRPGVNH